MDSKQRIHVMTLANSIIGVSILAMPYCFKQCGIVLSIVLLLFSSVLCRLACHFLLKSAIKARLRTFEFLAYHVFGSIGKLFVEIGMIGFLLGTCVAFFVVMGDLSPQIIAQLTETKSMATLRTTILIALALFCVLPLGLLRNVDSLSSVCIATILFYAILVLKIFIESAPHLANIKWYEHVDFWRPSGVLQCIPIFSMALFCQTQLFEIYQAIPNASLDKMNQLVKIAVNICTSIYIIVGVFGYIAVSHKPNFSGNILMDFEPSVVTETMKLGFVLSVAFSFPLVIFPCRASLYSLFYRPTYTGLHDSSNLYIPEGKFRFLTILIVSVSLIIGILIPNIELVLGLVGSTIGIMICVIFPATCFICLTNKNTSERVLAQAMLIIGIGVMVLGTYANLYAIDNIESTNFEYNKLTSKGIGVNINIQDVPVHNPPENNEKEIQIKLPDAVKEIKEIRHEPVQPEEPIEEPKEKVPKLISDNKKGLENVEEAVKKLEETLSEPKVKSQEKDKPEKKEEVKDLPLVIVSKVEKDSIPEMDLEAIKKEDHELEKGVNVKEKLVAHEKLLEQEKELLEQNKKVLEEIKIQQQQQQVNVEKLIAVKNIQSIAQKAIETIVDEKLKDPVILQKIEKENVDEIKNIVLQSDQKDEKVKEVQDKPSNEDKISKKVNSSVKSEPLSYQLGLHQMSNDKNLSKPENLVIADAKAELVQNNVDGESKMVETKHDTSTEKRVVDIIEKSVDKKALENEMKHSVEMDVIKKNFTEFFLNPVKVGKAVNDRKQNDEAIAKENADRKDDKVEDAKVADTEIKENKQEEEAVEDKEIREKKEAEKKREENMELRREILSEDYDNKVVNRSINEEKYEKDEVR